MNVGVLFETVLLAPVLQSAFGSADPFGQFGSAIVAQSLAQRDGGFARLVQAAAGGDR
jgi:hypothetical protein